MASPVTVITGASAGLGVDFARQLSAKGQRLVLVARRGNRLEALAAELGNARALELDLSVDGAADRLMADIAAHGETVDTLINNAGFGQTGRFADQDGKRMRQMIDLNCGVLTELCHAVIPDMKSAGKGAILNVASTAAFQPGPGMAVYFATKAYVLSFSEALHEELKGEKIVVSTLCPGPTATEFGEVAGFGGHPIVDNLTAGSVAVVKAGIEGLETRKTVVIPGFVNKMGAQGHRFLPRAVLRKIAGTIKL